ncbi:MAG: helix-turn-helix transcriptional regulator [Oscillospiraceae bacterium]|nr:helix-turn-helix transcriptional regulator [Oscillospiraceae bacterium]
MTQKQLGMAVSFDDKSADVRIAQYESGTRTPKQALVEQLAEVLDANTRFLADDEILGTEGVMMMLFELDEHYPISIADCEDGNNRKDIVFGSILMTDLLSEWQIRKKDLADGKISKAEYMEWKLN